MLLAEITDAVIKIGIYLAAIFQVACFAYLFVGTGSTSKVGHLFENTSLFSHFWL